MIHTHQTAPTQFVEANGIRFAYRRFGKSTGVPLVFNQHYTGTMDHWDPAVTDGFAKSREVILFNNAGVSSSSGEVPATFAKMGANAVAFIKALGLERKSMCSASRSAALSRRKSPLQAPDLVRRLVLVGTGPRGGEGMEGGRQRATASSARPMIRPIIFGLAFSSRRRRRARRRAANFSSASASSAGSRSRSDRQSGAGTARSDRQMGRADANGPTNI